MSQVSKQHPIFFISDYYNKIIDQIWIETTEMTGEKRLQKNANKIFFYLPYLKEHCLKKQKRRFSNQSGDVI